MTELQKLYNLRRALQTQNYSYGEMQKIDSPYEKKRKNCNEAIAVSEAKSRLERAQQHDGKMKGLLWTLCTFATGVIIILIMLVVAYVDTDYKMNNVWSEEMTMGISSPYELIFGYYVFVGAIIALITSLETIQTLFYEPFNIVNYIRKECETLSSKLRAGLSLFWVAFTLFSYLFIMIFCFVSFEEWDNKIFGLLLPLVPILLLLMFLLCLLTGTQFIFSWEVLSPFVSLLLGCLVATLVIKLLNKLIDKRISQLNFANEELIISCKKALTDANKKLWLAQAKINEERDSKTNYRELCSRWDNASEIVSNNNVVPNSDKDIQTVNNIIWCFEQKYANSVKEAKQWLSQQAHNEKVQSQLREISRKQAQLALQQEITNERLGEIYDAIPSSIEVNVDVRID